MKKFYTKEQVKQILYFNRKKLTESIILSKRLRDMGGSCVSHSIKHITGASDKDIIKATMKLKTLGGFPGGVGEHRGRSEEDTLEILKHLGHKAYIVGHPGPGSKTTGIPPSTGRRLYKVARKFNKGNYLLTVDPSKDWPDQPGDERDISNRVHWLTKPRYSHMVAMKDGVVHDISGITTRFHRVGKIYKVFKRGDK